MLYPTRATGRSDMPLNMLSRGLPTETPARTEILMLLNTYSMHAHANQIEEKTKKWPENVNFYPSYSTSRRPFITAELKYCTKTTSTRDSYLAELAHHKKLKTRTHGLLSNWGK